MSDAIIDVDIHTTTAEYVFHLSQEGEFTVTHRGVERDGHAFECDFSGTIHTQDDLDCLVADMTPFMYALGPFLHDAFKVVERDWIEAEVVSKRRLWPAEAWEADLHHLRLESTYHSFRTLLSRLTAA